MVITFDNSVYLFSRMLWLQSVLRVVFDWNLNFSEIVEISNFGWLYIKKNYFTSIYQMQKLFLILFSTDFSVILRGYILRVLANQKTSQNCSFYHFLYLLPCTHIIVLYTVSKSKICYHTVCNQTIHFEPLLLRL